MREVLEYQLPPRAFDFVLENDDSDDDGDDEDDDHFDGRKIEWEHFRRQQKQNNILVLICW